MSFCERRKHDPRQEDCKAGIAVVWSQREWVPTEKPPEQVQQSVRTKNLYCFEKDLQ